jgi:hypothetical protein
MSTSKKASPLDFKGTEIIDARSLVKGTFSDIWKEKPAIIIFLRRLGCQLCRTTALELDDLRIKDVEPKGGKVVAMTFEHLGTGSDSDKSFEKGGYFKGPLYVIDKSVYPKLFGSRNMVVGIYELFTASKAKIDESVAKGVQGNYKNGVSDGFMLGGQFVIDTDGTILLDHRQAFVGDDEERDGLLEAILKSKAITTS